ncbi:tRNA-dihydrouridine(47) synthase [NAD(P)(+)]-like protein, partial [Coemansia spiralis]
MVIEDNTGVAAPAGSPAVVVKETAVDGPAVVVKETAVDDPTTIAEDTAVDDQTVVAKGVAPNRAMLEPRKDKLCLRVSLGEECVFGDSCTFSHDIAEYMAKKEPDLGPSCAAFDAFGVCGFGLRCRFAAAHTTAEHRQIVDEAKVAAVDQHPTVNEIPKATQIRLRKKQVPFPRTAEFDARWQADRDNSSSRDETTRNAAAPAKRERRPPVDFGGKTYLAPLTTVGNLPFRRVCKEFGVDITCSEMAIANNIVQGNPAELALLKRHKSETIFGVQLAGSRADVIGRATEFVSSECAVDFIDLNMGCPIEMAYNNGGGSALLAQPRRIERIVRTMRHVADCDITVKFRTGVKNNVNVAHELAPQFEAWGAAMGTLHGRSRQQRYTKSADWDYI